jgi:hypothetical protein
MSSFANIKGPAVPPLQTIKTLGDYFDGFRRITFVIAPPIYHLSQVDSSRNLHLLRFAIASGLDFPSLAKSLISFHFYSLFIGCLLLYKVRCSEKLSLLFESIRIR